MSTDRTTEILNYLSAMTRRIGEFRAETKSNFEKLEARMEGLETRVNGLEIRFDNLEERFDKLDDRFDRLEARFDRLESRFERLEVDMRAGFDDVRSDIRRLNHKFEVVSEELTEVKLENRDARKRIEAVEKKVGITDDI